MTSEQLGRMPLPPEPPSQPRHAGEFMITRVTATCEILAEERARALETVRWPLAVIVALKQDDRTRDVLAPLIYVLASPLGEAEQAQLRSRQETQLRELDEHVAKTHPILVRLTEAGADPIFILSVLVRYMPIRGTEGPRAQSVAIKSDEFDVSILGDRTPSSLASLANWDAGRIDKLPLRLAGAKHIPSQPRSRRRPGPAEAVPSTGMALLADHVLAATRDRNGHSRDIADLVRAWAPWLRGDTYLTGKHVYNRVRRVKQSKAFRPLAQEEELRHRLEAALCVKHFAAR